MRGLCGVVALVVVVALGCRARSGVEPVHPPILLIVVDTLRADYLGAYGFRGDVSPAIDRLAAESVLFEGCRTVAPWTKPAMASLFTSLSPSVHGVTNHEGRYWGEQSAAATTGILVPEALTLAEVLQGAGYRTAGFNANPWMIAKYGFAQGFETWAEYPDSGATARMLADADGWLRLHGDASTFVYVHLMDVHAPYRGPRPDFEALRASPSLGDGPMLSVAEEQAIPSHLDGDPRLASAERRAVPAWRAKYAAGIRALDRRLASFLQRLRADGTLDRSLVVLLADHGEELYDHGGWDHGYTVYEELLHVPLLIRMPHAVGGGRRLHGIVTLLDVMPTILALAGVPVPAGLEGRSLATTSGDPSGSDDLDGPAVLASTALERRGLHAVRVGRYKLIVDLEGSEEHLFDLAHDPGEHQELATSRPEIARALRARLTQRLTDLAAPPALERRTLPVDDTTKDRLRALGYVH
jgi:arylsulfatase A-like enzyme